MEFQQPVFLCHNSRDKQEVESIYDFLHSRSVAPYMDKRDFEPFKHWESQLKEFYEKTPVVAVFIGGLGLGPYQVQEVKKLLENKKILRMGLVLLPSCPIESTQSSELQSELTENQWINFHEEDTDPVEKLIWGITGRRPETISVIELEQKYNNKMLADQIYLSRLNTHIKNLALTTSLFEIAGKKTSEVLRRLEEELKSARGTQSVLEEKLHNLQDLLEKRLSQSLKEIVSWLRASSEIALSSGKKAQNGVGKKIQSGREQELYDFTIKMFLDRIYTYLLDPKRDLKFLTSFSQAYLPPEAPEYIVDLYLTALDSISTIVKDSPYAQDAKEEVLQCIKYIRTSISNR